MTQQELAWKAGVSQSLISQIEQGRWACSGESGVAIAEALGLPIEAMTDLVPRGAYDPRRRQWLERASS